MKFLSAISFLTILPVPARTISGDGKQVLYFPLVGLVIGSLLYGVDHLLSLAYYSEVRIVGDVLFLTVISGALHLDGLADTADGIFSHRPRERILEIMKDSRIGVMGVLALLFCILLKIAGVAGIIQSEKLIWLILAPTLGRTALVIGLVFISHVPSEKTLAEQFYQRGKYFLLLFCPLPFALRKPIKRPVPTRYAAVGRKPGTCRCSAWRRRSSFIFKRWVLRTIGNRSVTGASPRLLLA